MSHPPLTRILYAEDEPDILEITVLSLESFGGFEVATCTSGAGVVALAHEFKPDLILLDVMMPDVDGPSALKALRADDDLKSIPVVFMTAKVMDHEVSELISFGAVSVISKPFVPTELCDRITEAWNTCHDT